MKRVYKAPEPIPFNEDAYTVFLAGSIEMGKAVDWQTELTNMILAEDDLKQIVVANPRRDDWDSTWTQSIENFEFAKQVNWELDNIEDAHFMVFVFDKDTISPITLLELGKVSASINAINTVVICPDGYFRKGNVDIVCEREGIAQVNDLNGIIKFMKERVSFYNELNWQHGQNYDYYEFDGEE